MRRAFDLHMLHVKNYFIDKVVLIGDALHTIHPLAGQGLNQGLLDAGTLGEVILAGLKNNRAINSRLVLRRFVR